MTGEGSPSQPERKGRYLSVRDNALHLMCEGGWGNESGGFSRSPQGFFFRISNEPEDIPEIQDAFSNEFLECGLDDSNEIVGHFLVIEDDIGLVDVEQFSNASDAVYAYMTRLSQFLQWLGYAQPINEEGGQT